MRGIPVEDLRHIQQAGSLQGHKASKGWISASRNRMACSRFMCHPQVGLAEMPPNTPPPKPCPGDRRRHGGVDRPRTGHGVGRACAGRACAVHTASAVPCATLSDDADALITCPGAKTGSDTAKTWLGRTECPGHRRKRASARQFSAVHPEQIAEGDPQVVRQTGWPVERLAEFLGEVAGEAQRVIPQRIDLDRIAVAAA